MLLQRGRCHDCGRPFKTGYFGRPRRCTYLDRLFCHLCHTNKKASLPCRVLSAWDFAGYAVCDAAHGYLTSTEDFPHLRMADVAPDVLAKCALLQSAQAVRQQLRALGDVVTACPNREFARQYADCFWVKNSELVSMKELRAIHAGYDHLYEYLRVRNALIAHCRNQCEVCHRRSARRCPACLAGKELFVWDTDGTATCPACKAPYHAECLPPDACRSSLCPRNPAVAAGPADPRSRPLPGPGGGGAAHARQLTL